MSLTNSNTFVEPVASSTLNSARQKVNNSLHSLLSNFKSTSAPVGVNIVVGGASTGPVEGMLFRNDANKALYIYDTANDKNGTGFTRNGIGTRIEEGLAGLQANAEKYEIGEIVATVSQNPALASAARLYLCTANNTLNGTLNGFIDVGTPQYYTITNTNNVEISSSRVSVSDLYSTGSVFLNGSFSGTSKGLVINSSTGVAGHALYSKAFSGPAVTADGSAITSSPTGVIESISGAVDNFYLWCSYGSVSNFVGGVKADTASSVQYLTTSDYRLKDNIKPLVNSTDRLKALQVYSYNFKHSNDTHDGMLAHEVQEIVPHAVSGRKDDINGYEEPVYQSMDYSRIVPLLVSSLQESIKKIEELENRLAILEN